MTIADTSIQTTDDETGNQSEDLGNQGEDLDNENECQGANKDESCDCEGCDCEGCDCEGCDCEGCDCDEGDGHIYLSYNEEWYDVTKFDHPGEGIRGIYLPEFNGKAVDEELHREHYTNDPYEILEEAKEKGECEGIIFIGKKTPREVTRLQHKRQEIVTARESNDVVGEVG